MDNSWVKLYRKLINHDVMQDATALQVFVWCMLHVDKKTGKFISGRFIGAGELNIKPSTFRDAVYRLRDKYKIIDTKSDNKQTEFSLLNWAKYNEYGKPATSLTTTKRQPDDNKATHIQDIKTIDIKTENYEKSSDFSEIKKSLGVPEKSPKGITTEHQAEGLRIAKALGVSPNRYSAYFKVVKEKPRGIILDAYAFAQDYLNPEARDKMFFHKINHL